VNTENYKGRRTYVDLEEFKPRSPWLHCLS